MRRILFARTENWIVLFLLTLAFVGAVLFGSLVQYRADGDQRFRSLGDAATTIAHLPRVGRSDGRVYQLSRSRYLDLKRPMMQSERWPHSTVESHEPAVPRYRFDEGQDDE